MNRARARHAIASLVLAAMFVARGSDAADTETSQRAEALYTEGKRLAAAGAHAEACPKFEESQKLEPAIGTQFNLADCYEAVGRRATALALFREVARVAQLTGKQERLKAAEERAGALETSVGRIVVDTTQHHGEARARIDGIETSREDAARGVPADPGSHKVSVEASGFEPWSSDIVVPNENGARVVATAPALRRIDREVIKPVVVSESSPPLRPLGIGLLSAGGAGLVVGGIFGLIAVNQKNDAGCDGTDCRNAPPGSASTLRDAQKAGTVSTIAFAAGGVLAAAGIGVLVFGPSGSTSSAPSSARFSLEMGPATAHLRGRF